MTWCNVSLNSTDWHGLQDALDLIEFVSGPADSEWGSVRNKMGRAKPWDLNYFAIGNEVSAAATAHGTKQGSAMGSSHVAQLVLQFYVYVACR